MASAADSTCPICYAPILNEDLTASHDVKTSDDSGLSAKVTHIFHRSCFSEWVDRMGSEATCPICRAPASEFGEEYNYLLPSREKTAFIADMILITIFLGIGRAIEYSFF